jgi:Domain of unknown function (DUF4145)
MTAEIFVTIPLSAGVPARRQGGDMRCPVCNQNTPDSWRHLLVDAEGGGTTHGLRVNPPSPRVPPEVGLDYIVSTEVSLDYMYCANDECKQLVIRVHERDTLPPSPDRETSKKTWLARPRSTGRALDPLVPEKFRKDYGEAAAILDMSPRMSGVLSRRILADLLEDYAKLDQFSLNARIKAFIADTSHTSRLRENLHHLREIGDFGAHTQKNDQAEIVDVGRDEAEWTLDILDGLFDYFIIAPERDRQMRDTMDERLKAAGRKAIEPLPDDEDRS